MTEDTQTPDIDKDGLKQKAQDDPKSKKWNNANSRRNLKQYQDPIVPEVLDESPEDEESDVAAIVVGRKLNPDLVRKMMPQRGVLTAAEKKRM